MYRVDAITLTPDSSIGPMSIGAPACPLHEFDLIVITGGNGSGRTSLTAPLRTWSDDVQRRWCLATRAEPADLDPKSDIVPSLLVRDSMELLGDFASIEAALANAVGVERRRSEAALLSMLVPVGNGGQFQLSNLVSTVLDERPQQVRSAMEDVLQAEEPALEALHAAPLTLATYNALGATAARLAGKPWQDVMQLDVAAMIKAEGTLRPTAVIVEGMSELINALRDFRRDTSTEAAHAAALELVAAKSALSAARSDARSRLEAPEDEVEDVELGSRCTAAAAAASAEERRLAGEIEKLDELENLRADARAIIERDSPADCPVCAQPIEVMKVLDRLRGIGLSQLAEQLRKSESEFRETKSELTAKAEAISQAALKVDEKQRRVNSAIEDWQAPIKNAIKGLESRVNWDKWVTTNASKALGHLRTLATQVEQFVAKCEGFDPEELTRRLTTVRDVATDIMSDATSRGAERDTAMIEAEQAVNKMQLLRRVLDARYRLNSLDWQSKWYQRHSAKVQGPRLERWKAVVSSMVADRNAETGTLYEALLNDSDIERRFVQLLRAFRPHELLSSPALERDSVKNAGVLITKKARTPSRLSEGYRAIVNLAAFVAVAGHVGKSQRHVAGWILIDEPTNGLDPDNRDRLADHLGSLSMLDMPKQVFVTTFEPSFAQRLIDAAREAGHRRILKIEMKDWSTRPASQPVLIRAS